MQMYARLLKYSYRFLLYQTKVYFFKLNLKKKITPRNYEQNWSSPLPSTCSSLPPPGSSAAQRDTQHKCDCHSERGNQEFTSTGRLHGNRASRLTMSGELHGLCLQKQLGNDRTREIPKECL